MAFFVYLCETFLKLMKKQLFLTLFFAFINYGLYSQQREYWLILKDKCFNYTELNLTTLLSPQALAKRASLGIPLDETDLPVCQDYINKITQKGYSIISSSKWLNAIVIQTDKTPQQISQQFDFVKDIIPCRKLSYTSINSQHKQNEHFNYGYAQKQLEQLGIDSLHRWGFTGKNVRIAVLDAGFPKVDVLTAFDSLRLQNRLIDYFDFVETNNAVFDDSEHGTNVLSLIGSNRDAYHIGAAPHAHFLLARTENTNGERRIEEYNWLRGAEWAESLGVDIITTSLGYSDFDGTEEDYTYSQMDGRTTIVAKAANIAANKGILVVSSAGNEGEFAWQKIVSPCDAESVLCVGAVNSDSTIADYSSRGPSGDGRIKPNVVALGTFNPVITTSDIVSVGGRGTSFACPLIAGLAACLKQAFPFATNMQIFKCIEKSGDKYSNPDTLYGNGLPNGIRAYNCLANEPINPPSLAFKIYPQPTTNSITWEVSSPDFSTYNIIVYDVLGKLMLQQNNLSTNFKYHLNPEMWGSGLYIMKCYSNTFDFVKKFTLSK